MAGRTDGLIKNFEASGAIPARHFVKFGAGDDLIALATASTDAIIGVSCYDSIGRARDLAAQGASYLAFGAFFASPTKPHARRATTALLREAKALGVPRVAIGGITAENGRSLIDAGADYLAAISAVFGADDVRAAARSFAALFDTDHS